jgi:hypothetical protein
MVNRYVHIKSTFTHPPRMHISKHEAHAHATGAQGNHQMCARATQHTAEHAHMHARTLMPCQTGKKKTCESSRVVLTVLGWHPHKNASAKAIGGAPSRMILLWLVGCRLAQRSNS